ncbi:MAG: DUF4349 domain-containing protein [Ruminococcaceae bacterium]|jgi:hypothetical protein|nr:DUF4349 domain-containing protein [Oscillospiraceae bacterium]
MKRIISILLSLLLVLSLAACGSSNGAAGNSDGGYHGGGEVVDTAESGWNGSVESSRAIEAKSSNTKMIYTASIELETLAFDDAMTDIKALVADVNGYYQDQTVGGFSSGYRYADLTVRIPSEQFASFCDQVGSISHLIRLNTAQENISESYYDVDSRLNTAKTKLARLQELLAQAESMEDIITIESAISDTEQIIDSLSGTLRNYDNLLDYATVRISLSEVYKLSGTREAPLTLGQKIGNAFTDGLESIGDFFEGLVIFLAYSWFWILAAAVIVVLVIRGLRRKRGRRKSFSGFGKSKQPSQEDSPVEDKQ